MRTLLTSFAALATASLAIAQNGELSVVHGLPGITGTVDVALNGATAFSGLSYGDTQTATVAAGSYSIDIVQGGNILLSGNATIADGENISIAAHLQVGGASDLTVFQNDLSAVSVFGQGRVWTRNVADAPVLLTSIESPALFSFGVLPATAGIPYEVAADTYEVRALPFSGSSGTFQLPFPPTALTTGPEGVAADEGLIVYFTGVPNTPSFRTITQRVALEPAMPQMPNVCDLTVSGSLVGGSLSTGGDLTYDLSGATPNSFAVLFLASDNNPSSFFGIDLGIGSTSLIPFGFGTTDPNGDYSQTLVFPGFGGSIPGTTTPITLDLFGQAASIDFGTNSGGFNVTCVSDIEAFQVSL